MISPLHALCNPSDVKTHREPSLTAQCCFDRDDQPPVSAVVIYSSAIENIPVQKREICRRAFLCLRLRYKMGGDSATFLQLKATQNHETLHRCLLDGHGHRGRRKIVIQGGQGLPNRDDVQSKCRQSRGSIQLT